MFKRARLLVVAGALAACIGCGESSGRYRVKAFSGGKQVGEWTADGKPAGTDSNIWFRDHDTRRDVEVSGSFVVTEVIDKTP